MVECRALGIKFPEKNLIIFVMNCRTKKNKLWWSLETHIIREKIFVEPGNKIMISFILVMTIYLGFSQLQAQIMCNILLYEWFIWCFIILHLKVHIEYFGRWSYAKHVCGAAVQKSCPVWNEKLAVGVDILHALHSQEGSLF